MGVPSGVSHALYEFGLELSRIRTGIRRNMYTMYCHQLLAIYPITRF